MIGENAGARNHGDEATPEEAPFYIVAPSPTADDQARVLKQGDAFAVFDHYGDVKPVGLGEEGLYFHGTRFLSCLLLSLGPDRPLFLSSTVKEDNDVLAVDLTNPDVSRDGRVAVPRGRLHIARTKFLWRGVCYERLRLKNYHDARIDLSLALTFDADFSDIFEVRGMKRSARGRRLKPVLDGGAATLSYEGLDGVKRRTRLTFAPPPTRLTAKTARFDVSLPEGGETALDLAVACETGDAAAAVLPFGRAETEAAAGAAPRCAFVLRGNERFDDWVNRACADLHMMVTETPTGPYPYAGVPWFSTAFGRDGIITALECLWFDPSLARGVLAYLAANQAVEVDPERDAQPGKVLHETRGGEMAALGEIPFGRYYGSVDATPLFVLLAGAYYERTGDRPFVESIWPNLEAALRWIDDYGDVDRDGFVEYARSNPQGLVHQGWKDSHDAIFHADGSSAAGPIALCEVQGYVYAARRAAALLARVLGRARRADELERQAAALRERFEAAFWCDDLDTYALALDGRKRPCRVRDLQRRPVPVHRRRLPGTRRPRRPDAAGAGVVFRLGRAHGRLFRGPLQPDVVSQRLGVAARQRPHRLGPRPLRPERRGGGNRRRPARRQPVPRFTPHAGAVLWLLPAARGRADALPGGLRAAGVVGGRGVPAGPVLPRPDRQRPGTPGLFPRAASAAGRPRVAHRGAARRRGVGGFAGAQPRRRRGRQRPAARGGPARVGGEVSPYDLFGGVRAHAARDDP